MLASRAERRFFIALGSGRYRDLPADDQLPHAASDIAKMAQLFEGFGYQTVLAGLGHYDSADQIKQKLSYWSRDITLSHNDVVVLYFAGHGATVGRDRHYLFCWDSQEDDLAATALATEDLIRILCRGRLRHLLLILDTCAGGAGGADAATFALQAVAYRQSGDDVSTGLWFLSSARRKDAAGDGAFANCFGTSITTAIERTGQRQRYVDLSTLIGAINERFETVQAAQRAELAGGLVTGLAPFIPNSGFRDDLPPAGTDLEVQRRIADRDLSDHFGPRSRGVEYESEQGQYFSGRGRVLSELVSWLTAAGSDCTGRIVTGNPGCGKSAVLGRIVALSDPDYRARIDLTDADPATVVPENRVAVAVHARHKALEEVVAKIAAGLGIDSDGPASLLQELSRRSRSESSLVVVVDALDEAGSGTAADAGGRGEPRRIARELLRPLSEIAGVRLLVGTRRELLTSLGTTFVTLDLDLPVYRTDDDVAGYVRQVLLAVDEPDIPTPYRGRTELAQQVGDGVALRASGVFLVARMTARSLRSAPLVDTTKAGWVERLPSEIGAALDDFLARFGPDELRVRRMLLPLAFAEGQGLPRGEIWTRLASVLSGVRCTEEDVSWALDVAAPYVSEVTEGARSVYRLFHQSLAEHLRDTAGRTTEDIQTAIVDALASTVPLTETEGPDWFAAPPYVNQHLATHAAAARVLDRLVGDPAFLLAGNQLALLRAFTSIASEDSRRVRSAYEQVAHRLTPSHPVGERAADLQLSARRCGADTLAARIDRLGIDLPWSARWAWWSASGAHRVLSGHKKDVLCVATGDLDGRPIAVTGSSDRTVRIWDLISQRQVGKPLEATVPISSVAIGDLDDYTVALAGGIDGIVHVWDLSSGQQLGEPLEGHTSGIGAIALEMIQGVPVALTASLDGTARLWNLDDRTQLGPPLTKHRRTVRAAALGLLDGQPIAVTGGEDKRAYVWDLSGLIGGTPIPPPRALIGHSAKVTAVAITRRESTTVALVGDATGMLSVWDLDECQQIGEPLSAHWHYQPSFAGVASIAVYESAAVHRILTTGPKDSKLWDLGTLRQHGHSLRGHVGIINGASLVVGPQGSLAVTVSRDRTARIWDLSIAQPATGHTDSVRTLAFAEIDGTPFGLTGGTGGTARLWNLRSRSEIGHTLDGHSEEVRSGALGKLHGRLLAVTAGTDATIRLWDPLRGLSLRLLRGHTNAVNQVLLAELNGVTTLLSASEDGTIRLWDLSTGAAIALTGHIGSVSRIAVRQTGSAIEIAAVTTHDQAYLWRVTADHRTYLEAHLDLSETVAPTSMGLNVAFLDSHPIVLFSREDNGIHAVDIRTAAKVGMPVLGHTELVRYATVGQIGSQTVVASIAYDETVRIADLVSGTPLGTPFSIRCRYTQMEVEFTFGRVDGVPVGFTCSPEEVRMWDLHSMLPIGEPLCGGGHDVTALSIMPAPAAIPGPPLVVSGGFEGAIRVHSLSDGKQVTAHLTSVGQTYAMATAPVDDDIIAVQGGYREIHVWSLRAQRRIGTLSEPDAVYRLVTHQMDDRWIVVSTSEDSTLRVWDLVTRSPLGAPMAGHTAQVTDLATVRGKNLLVSTASDGTARIWDLRTQTAVGGPLDGHELGAKAVAVGRLDGRNVIVTGDGSGYVRAWDLLSREPVSLDVVPHPDAIARLRLKVFNDEPILVVADASGRVRVWNLAARMQIIEINAESGIQDMALTGNAELCVATEMGVAMLKMGLAKSGD